MTRELDIGAVLIFAGILLIFAKPRLWRWFSHIPLRHNVADRPDRFLNIVGGLLIALGVIYALYAITGQTDCEQIQAMVRESLSGYDDAGRIYGDEEVRECLRE